MSTESSCRLKSAVWSVNDLKVGVIGHKMLIINEYDDNKQAKQKSLGYTSKLLEKFYSNRFELKVFEDLQDDMVPKQDYCLWLDLKYPRVYELDNVN